MGLHVVQTIVNRSVYTFQVSDAEYDRLRAAGLIYAGPSVDSEPAAGPVEPVVKKAARARNKAVKPATKTGVDQ